MGGLHWCFFPYCDFYQFFNDSSFIDFIDLKSFSALNLFLGLELGIVYGFISYLFVKSPFFEKIPNKIDHLVKGMNLKVHHGLFLSFCAAVGEELLFRAGLQSFLGPFLCSIVFVALHGYLNPFNLRFSVYGLIVLPFILLISYGMEPFGLLFCIAAHLPRCNFIHFHDKRRLMCLTCRQIEYSAIYFLNIVFTWFLGVLAILFMDKLDFQRKSIKSEIQDLML